MLGYRFFRRGVLNLDKPPLLNLDSIVQWSVWCFALFVAVRVVSAAEFVALHTVDSAFSIGDAKGGATSADGRVIGFSLRSGVNGDEYDLPAILRMDQELVLPLQETVPEIQESDAGSAWISQISDDGRFALGSFFDPANGYSRYALWNLDDLGRLETPWEDIGLENARPVGLSGDGETVLCTGRSLVGSSDEVWTWKRSSDTFERIFPSEDFSNKGSIQFGVRPMSRSGEQFVGYITQDGREECVIWDHGESRVLPKPDLNNACFPLAISENGKWILGFVWNQSGLDSGSRFCRLSSDGESSTFFGPKWPTADQRQPRSFITNNGRYALFWTTTEPYGEVMTCVYDFWMPRSYTLSELFAAHSVFPAIDPRQIAVSDFRENGTGFALCGSYSTPFGKKEHFVFTAEGLLFPNPGPRMKIDSLDEDGVYFSVLDANPHDRRIYEVSNNLVSWRTIEAYEFFDETEGLKVHFYGEEERAAFYRTVTISAEK